MDAAKLISAVYSECGYLKEERDARERMAEILRENGWHVCENDADLREAALAHTDLVEPS